MERGLQYRDLQYLDVFGIQRDVQCETQKHIVRQCEQSSATLPRRAKYSRAQIAIMGFRFPSFMVIAIPQIVAHYRSNFLLLSTTRGLSIKFRLHELAFAGRKIGNGSRNETRFSSPRQKKFSSRLNGALREVNYTGTRFRVSGDIDNIAYP